MVSRIPEILMNVQRGYKKHFSEGVCVCTLHKVPSFSHFNSTTLLLLGANYLYTQLFNVNLIT